MSVAPAGFNPQDSLIQSVQGVEITAYRGGGGKSFKFKITELLNTYLSSLLDDVIKEAPNYTIYYDTLDGKEEAYTTGKVEPSSGEKELTALKELYALLDTIPKEASTKDLRARSIKELPKKRGEKEADYTKRIAAKMKELHTAANQKIEEAREEISQKAVAFIRNNTLNLKERDLAGDTLLTYACRHNLEDVALELIEKGADVNDQNTNQTTPLVFAAHYSSMPLVKKLIEKGADVNKENKDGITPLLQAIDYSQIQVALYLIKKGADVDKSKTVPLSDGTRRTISPLQLINERIMSNANNPDSLQDKQHSGISIAAQWDPLIQQILLKTNKHKPSEKREDAAEKEVRAFYASKGIIKTSQQIKEEIKEAKDTNGSIWKKLGEDYKEDQDTLDSIKTHKDRAIKSSSSELFGPALIQLMAEKELDIVKIKRLVEQHVDLTERDANGETALIIACAKENAELAKLFIEADADVNMVSKNGYTALLYASENGMTEIVRLLINENAKLDIKEKEKGHTALYYACKNNHTEIAKLLIDAGADVAGTDSVCSGIAGIIDDMAEKGAYTNPRELGKILIDLIIDSSYRIDERLKQNLEVMDSNLLHFISEINKKVEISEEERKKEIHARKEKVAAEKIQEQEKAEDDKKLKTDRALILIERGAALDVTDANNETCLLIACSHKASELALKLIKKNADINKQGNQNNTALIYAAQNDLRYVVLTLIKKGADLNAVNMDGNTAFMTACSTSNVEIALDLLMAGTDTSIANTDGKTALSLCEEVGLIVVKEAIEGYNKQGDKLLEAVSADDIATVSELLKTNINPHSVNSEGKTALILAIEKKDIDMVNLLISNKGALINKGDSYKNTPLMYAVKAGFKEGIKLLLDKKVPVNILATNGFSALSISCQEEEDSITFDLIRAGANTEDPTICGKRPEVQKEIEASREFNRLIVANREKPALDKFANMKQKLPIKDSNGNTSLMLACEHNLPTVVDALLKDSPAMLNEKNKKGETALQIALEKKYPAIANTLISKGADITVHDREENTPLMIASKHGFNTLIEPLTADMNRIDITNYEGLTALMFACIHGHTEIMEDLITKNANINTKDINKNTALLYACKYSHAAAALALLARDDIIVNSKDSKDQTALDFCDDMPEVATVLKTKGGVFSNGKRLLDFFQLAKPQELIIQLIDEGANLTVRDKTGHTALHYACFGNYEDIALYLIERGADVEATVSSGKNTGFTVLMIAALQNLEKVVDKLLRDPVIIKNIDAINATKKTALEIACLKRNESIAIKLIRKGATVPIQSSCNNLQSIQEEMYAMNGDIEKGKQLLKLIKKGFAGVEPALKLLDEVKPPLLTLKTNTVDGYGETALLYAIRKGTLNQVVFRLIEKGANVNATRTVDNQTPLILLSLWGGDGPETEIIARLLIENGADVNAKDKFGKTALDYVCKKEEDVSMKRSTLNNNFALYLISMGGAGALYENGRGPMFSNKRRFSMTSEGVTTEPACIRLPDVTKAVADFGVKRNNDDNQLPISQIYQLNPEVLGQYLIKQIMNENYYNALILLKGYPDLEQHSQFTDYGVADKLKNKQEKSALVWAAEKGYTAIVKKLIAQGARDTIPDKGKNLALHYACKGKYREAALLLVDAGAALESQGNLGGRYMSDPIHLCGKDPSMKDVVDTIEIRLDHKRLSEKLLPAIIAKDKTLVLEYINKGADLTQKNTDGYGSLTLAIINDLGIEIMKRMIEVGADVNEMSTNKITPLLAAVTIAEPNRLEYIKQLLYNGANPSMSNSEKSTPLHLVCGENDEAAALTLIQAGALVNTFNKDSLYVLDVCTMPAVISALVERGATSIIKGQELIKMLKERSVNESAAIKLINEGANIHTLDDNGNTALHIACRKGFESVVARLIEKHASIDQPNEKGDVPLILACSGDYDTIVIALIAAGADVTDITEACHRLEHDTKLLFNDDHRIMTAKTLLQNITAMAPTARSKATLKTDEADSVAAALLRLRESLSKITGLKTGIGSATKTTPSFSDGLALIAAIKAIDKPEILTLLGKDPKPSIECRDENGNTALHLIALPEFKDIIDTENKKAFHALYYEQLDSVNATNYEGQTPLMRASIYNLTLYMKFLFGAKADLDAVDQKGDTALILACLNQSKEAALLLIDEGAEVNIAGLDGRTAFSLCDKTMDGIAGALIEKGAIVPEDSTVAQQNANLIAASITRNKMTTLNLSPALTLYMGRAIIYSEEETAKLKPSREDIANIKQGFKNMFLGKMLVNEIRNENTKGALELIEAGALVDSVDEEKTPALFWACMKDMEAVALALIKKGANVSKSTGDRFTHVTIESVCDNLPAVRTAIERAKIKIKADPKQSLVSLIEQLNPDKTPPVNKPGLIENIYSLIDQNVKLTETDREGYTPLLLALKYKAFDIAETLWKAGANVNAVTYKGDRPLSIACKHRNEEIAIQLIKAGAWIHVRDADFKTPYEYANDTTPPFKRLDALLKAIKAREDIETTLFNAIKASNETDALRILNDPSYKLDPTLRTTFTSPRIPGKFVGKVDLAELNAFHLASLLNQVSVAKRLIEIIIKEAPEAINSVDEHNKTALMYAALGNLEQIVKILLEIPSISINAVDFEQDTALLMAAQNNNVNILNLLLAKGATLNMKNKAGNTALLIAANNNYEDIIAALLKAKADITVKTTAGKTALDILKDKKGSTASIRALEQYQKKISNGYELLEQLEKEDVTKEALLALIDKGADLTVQTEEGYTALFLACFHETVDESVILRLLQAGVDVNKASNDGITPLMAASLRKREKIVLSLLDAGAITDAEYENQTALDIAADEGASETLLLTLLAAGTGFMSSIEIKPAYTLWKAALRKYNIGDPLPAIGSSVDATTDSKEKISLGTKLLVTLQTIVPDTSKQTFIKNAYELITQGADLTLKDKDGNTALLLACKNNYIEAAINLILGSASINDRDPNGNTPLMLISSKSIDPNVKELFIELLNYGADIDALNTAGKSALDFACEANNELFVLTLLSAGAAISEKTVCESLQAIIDIRRKKESIPLSPSPPQISAKLVTLNTIHAGLAPYDKTTVDRLKAETTVVTTDNETKGRELLEAIRAAADGNAVDSILTLITPTVDLTVKDANDNTALLLAASKLFLEPVALKILEQPRADIFIRSRDVAATCLMIASKSGQINVVNELLKRVDKSHINYTNVDGNSALYVAIIDDKADIAEALIRAKASFKLAAEKRLDMFRAVTAAGSPFQNIATMDEFKREFGPELRAAIESKGRELLQAIESDTDGNRVDSILALITPTVDLTVKDANGNTALLLAANKDPYFERVTLKILEQPNVDILVKGSIPPDTRDHHRAPLIRDATCLMIASKSGQINVVNELLTRVDTSHINYTVETDRISALFLAISYRHADIAKLLIRAGASFKLGSRTRMGLFLLVINRLAEIAQMDEFKREFESELRAADQITPRITAAANGTTPYTITQAEFDALSTEQKEAARFGWRTSRATPPMKIVRTEAQKTEDDTLLGRIKAAATGGTAVVLTNEEYNNLSKELHAAAIHGWDRQQATSGNPPQVTVTWTVSSTPIPNDFEYGGGGKRIRHKTYRNRPKKNHTRKPVKAGKISF
jgi:ankyrin repeat protein